MKMTCHCLLLYFFGMSACFLAVTDAHEAIVDGELFAGNLFSEYCYPVSVQYLGHGHVCTGGIIGDRFILTAAHCLLNEARHLRYNTHINIHAGTNNLNETGPTAMIRRVKKVFFPEEFNSRDEVSRGDIAVLKLIESLQLRHHSNLEKLTLPPINRDNGKTAIIAGFGWNRYERIGDRLVGSADGRLRFILTDLTSNEECQRRYPHTAIQSDIHLCSLTADHGGKGVYTGDDGGPLTQGTNVIGILSRVSYNGNSSYHPAIYTRVAPYRQMILNVMRHNRDPNMVFLHA